MGVTPDGPLLLVLLAGSLAPDIDTNGVITTPGRLLRSLLGRTLGELVDMLFGLVVASVHAVTRHRGVLHSGLVPLVMLVAAVFWRLTWLEWFALGYAVHLLGDAGTCAGIPLLSPLSQHRFSLCSMSTGSRSEAVFASVLLGATCVWGWVLLPEPVRRFHESVFGQLASNALGSYSS